MFKPQNASSKIIFITGCSSGLGLSLAQVLSEKHIVYASLRNLKKVEELKKIQSPNLKILRVDVLEPQSIKAAAAEIEQNHGKIDVLINNAGVMHMGFFEDVEVKIQQKVMEINFFGVCQVTQLLLFLLKKSKQGKIINISSTSGRMAMPSLSGYAASKWALEGWSESLRFELLPLGIQVLLIEPGLIDTPLLHQNLSYTLKKGSPWEKNIERLLKRFFEMNPKRFLDVKKVSKLIQKRMNQKNPPFRTLISPLSKIKWLIRQLFPYAFYEKIILKIFN